MQSVTEDSTMYKTRPWTSEIWQYQRISLDDNIHPATPYHSLPRECHSYWQGSASSFICVIGREIWRDIPTQYAWYVSMIIVRRFLISAFDSAGNPTIFMTTHALVNELSDEKRFKKNIGAALNEVRNLVGDALFTVRITVCYPLSQVPDICF